MSRLFNLFIGILIILFFVAIGWSFIKSFTFINEQAAKLKAGTNSITENASEMGKSITNNASEMSKSITSNASAVGQSITEMPGKAKDYIEDGVADIKGEAKEEANTSTEPNNTATQTAEAEKIAQEEAAKSAAAEKAAADKKEALAQATKKEVPQEYDAASKRLNTSAADAAKAPYMVITGSFSQANNAELEVKKLTKMGYNAESVNLGTTQYLSVVAGRYPTLKEAQAIAKQLKGQGIAETYVHKRKVRK